MTKINVKGPIVGNDIGSIYHWLGWDCCCPNDIEAGLTEANGDDVVLEINSPGGYCDVGSEIYTIIMKYSGHVEAHIMAAASAASVIACAADKVLASDTMVFMIHNAHGSSSGDYRDLANASETLTTYDESIINAYMRKTGKSHEELQAMMDHTTWMSAEDAIKHGFVDGYLFGNPAESTRNKDGGKEGPDTMAAMNVMEMPVLSRDKALELTSMIKLAEKAAGISVGTKSNMQDSIGDNDSDTEHDNDTKTKNEGGNEKMTLTELLKEHPEAKDELEGQIKAAEESGAEKERSRLQELDSISNSVTPEMLVQAKYGDKPLDAKTLAYQALLADGDKAKQYMAHAVKDFEDSHVDAVGSNTSDPTAPKDESDAMAAVANAVISRGKNQRKEKSNG